MRASLLVLGLLSLAACDSADPVVPQPALLSFDLAGLATQVEVELTDTDTLTVPQALIDVPGGLILRSSSTANATALTTSVVDQIAVRGDALGDATVSLAFSAAGYRDTTATITVRVVPGVCPAEAPTGARDYFPVTDGAVSTYDYKTYSGGALQSTETLTSTVQNARCLRGRRTGEFRFSFATGSAETVGFAESAGNDVTFQTPAFGSPAAVVTFGRYAEASAPETLILQAGPCSAASVAFRDGVGFVSENATCGGIGGFSGRRIERQ